MFSTLFYMSGYHGVTDHIYLNHTLVTYRDKVSSSNMKIDTLSFLNCLMVNHNPQVFHPHMAVIVSVS